ncbi:MAG: T9SS type B sorting domain-containing protein, partial [Saprospiraceae bacterium]
DGPFGFIMSSGGDNTDIDINVWGPFTRQQVCDSQNVVINFITNNQPIRSSWSAGQIHTGLVDVHPDTGIPVTDVYDCDGNPGAGGDDFVSTIQAQLGDVYIVLANDFGEGIQENGMVIDWSPSLPAVIENPPVEVTNADTVICEGQSVQLIINAAIDDITWLNPIGLSCDDCPNPIATPEVTTIYQVAVEGVCLHDTIDVKVYVYNLYPMDDAIVCAGEEFQYVAIPQELPGATITWQDPGGLLSCTDCPNPIVLATTPGNYTLTVRLDAPLCTHYDTINVQVLQTPAPTYNIADNMQICQGDSVHLGGAHILGMNYEWSSVPAGFSSALADPVVAPDSTTQYYLQVTNGICPLPSIDSVLVTVNSLPLLAVVNDTLVCQGQSVVLGTTTTQNNVTYNWTPNIGLSNDTIPNPVSSPTATQTYTLSATIGACTTTEQVTINVTPIAIDIALDDSLRICKGTPVNIIANETPSGTLVSWLPNDGSLSSNTGDNVTANPTNTTLYVATVQVAGCTRKDSLFIQVDSLPNYALAISPQDTTVCQGALVILRSNPYDPAHFPFVDIEWIPSTGFVSPDSLYNIVLNATQTTTYNRIVTSGACKDTTSATVNVIETSSISVIPADTTVCFGQVVNFVASNPDTDEFMWQPPTGLSCTDCPNPSTTVYGSQTYIVSANVQGCPVSSSVTISIPPPPIFQLPENPVICLGQSLILNAQMDNETTYSWTSTDPSFVPTNAPSPTVSPSETQTYTLTATKGGCSINAQVTVTVAVATLTVDDEVTLCLGENATLNATGTLPGSLVWSNGENANSITVAPTESAYYSVVYTFGNGCTLTDSVYVNVVDNFILALDADPSVPEIHEGSNVQLTANTNPDLTNPSYVWTGNGAAIGGNNATVTVQPIINPSSYSVTVTSQNGCSHEATITFVVIPASYDIPNAFSPDGDNVNDLFRPIINGNINIEQFQIFDRWGQRVFESKTTDGWNGTFKDKPLPSDVYAYMLILNLPKGERKILKGDVTLLR